MNLRVRVIAINQARLEALEVGASFSDAHASPIHMYYEYPSYGGMNRLQRLRQNKIMSSRDIQ